MPISNIVVKPNAKKRANLTGPTPRAKGAVKAETGQEDEASLCDAALVRFHKPRADGPAKRRVTWFNKLKTTTSSQKQDNIDGPVMVVSIPGLSALFNEMSSNDPGWQRIECIQSNIKSALGIGVPLIINFFAPLNEYNQDKFIEYDYN